MANNGFDRIKPTSRAFFRQLDGEQTKFRLGRVTERRLLDRRRQGTISFAAGTIWRLLHVTECGWRPILIASTWKERPSVLSFISKVLHHSRHRENTMDTRTLTQKNTPAFV